MSDGGLPWRYAADGSVAVASPPKEVREFAGRQYVLEESITADFALVHARIGDAEGNLVFAKAAGNFNPLAAMAGRICIAQVEQLVEPGGPRPGAGAPAGDLRRPDRSHRGSGQADREAHRRREEGLT